MIGAVAASLPGPRAGSGSDAAKIQDAASQFEALLIGQLLKNASDAESGGALGGDDSGADSSMLEIAQEQLAQTLAKQGGLGIARLVVEGLDKPQSRARLPR